MIMKIHRMDHVGIIVLDLQAAKEFFVDLGLEVLGEADLEGDFVERANGLDDVRVTLAMLGVPGAQTNIELIQFHSPIDEKGIERPLANTLGVRHIAFAVKDIEAIVARLKTKGVEFISEIQVYEGIYKLCLCRGPEGTIIELDEKIK